MTEERAQKPGLDRSGKRRIVEVIFYFIISGAILFGCAGRLSWPEAWIYLGVGILLGTVMSIFIVRKNPEVINERGRRSKNTKTWDKVLGAFIFIALILFMVTAGLDARYGWSDVSLWIKILAFVAMVPGMILPYLAMLHNPFLATTVRIEEERGHRVATGGPYRWVRHPMYTGVVLSWFAGPVFLGSWWAVVPAGASVFVLIVRTVLEDRTLQRELEGYADYAARVRYRLVPGLW
jgi:protein-S-isoprenylcysteine O-methyltransferase Ste14